MADIEVTAILDITEDVCPMTMVKTKLKLEELKPGDILEVHLSDGDPIINVPKGVRLLGHKLLKITREGNKFRMIVKKERQNKA